jgi:prepilin-type N-terminal cleavage/methylation domain-containing protein
MRKYLPTKKSRGFTLIETLVVVTVIAILASVAIVSYRVVGDRARDTQRQSNVDTLADALKTYYGTERPNLDCGAVADPTYGNSSQPGYGHYMSGFISYDYDNSGPRKSIEKCLLDAKLIREPLRDPTQTLNCTAGSRECYSYMVTTCLTNGAYQTFVYANIQLGDRTATNLTDNTCQVAASYDSDYGMNYVKRVE